MARVGLAHPTRASWSAVWNNSYVIGDFIWTAIDYLGESSIGASGYNTPSLLACGGYCPQPWSYHVSSCGDLDLVGNRRPQSYYRAALWGVSDVELAVHAPVAAGQHEVIASWGWPDERQSWTWVGLDANTSLSVNVYTRHPAAQLLLNGRPVGSASPVPVSHATQFTASWQVPYRPGTLTGVAYDASGRVVANRTLETAGPAAALALSADRSRISASPSDLSYVTAQVVDSAGRAVPDARVAVSFVVEDRSAGDLEAVGSGDPLDATPTQSTTRVTYRGRVVAILRPNGSGAAGSITLLATAPALAPARLTVEVGGS